jgi:hypothetical protein
MVSGVKASVLNSWDKEEFSFTKSADHPRQSSVMVHVAVFVFVVSPKRSIEIQEL